MAELSAIFILLNIWKACVCFGERVSAEILCDANCKQRASHKGSIMDIAEMNYFIDIFKFTARN